MLSPLKETRVHIALPRAGKENGDRRQREKGEKGKEKEKEGRAGQPTEFHKYFPYGRRRTDLQ